MSISFGLIIMIYMTGIRKEIQFKNPQDTSTNEMVATMRASAVDLAETSFRDSDKRSSDGESKVLL